MAKDQKSENRVVYSEFGAANTEARCSADTARVERATPDLPPAQQNLRVQASRKGRKGKTVTVITGLQASEAVLTDLLKQLKSQCGAGGTVKEDAIEIQGDHTQKLVQVLTKLGYKAKISGG
jgi:translation initiation factor 1